MSIGIFFLLIPVYSINIPAATYHFVETKNYVIFKNYYLLSLFQSLPEVKKLLSVDKIFTEIATAKSDSLFAVLKNCSKDGACYIDRTKFTVAEIYMVNDRLIALYKPNNALGKLVQKLFILSGTYVLYQNLFAN